MIPVAQQRQIEALRIDAEPEDKRTISVLLRELFKIRVTYDVCVPLFTAQRRASLGLSTLDQSAN